MAWRNAARRRMPTFTVIGIDAFRSDVEAEMRSRMEDMRRRHGE
jgi:hypothetical protein